MGVGLGWQRMHSSNPYISGQAWSDNVTRSGNTVSYSLNLCMKVEKASGYWDYVWYVDMQVGSNVSDNRKVKNSTSWHQIIGGREYYQSTFNGNFTGSINVSGKATSIQLRAQFHDSHGNRGPNVYWNVPIPAATSMDDIKKEVSGVGSDIASISAKVTKTGNYSTITSWKLEYGVRNYSENVKTISGNNLSVNWLLENLLADTNYKYRITVSNSSGYSKQATGAFRTEEEVIGYRVTKGELIEPGVYEDGEASGEFVQIDNTYENEGQITSVEMLGNATQAGTPTPDSPQPISVVTGENTVNITGKNLAKIENITTTSHGMTYTFNEDGTITLNGTSDAVTSQNATLDYPIHIKAGQIYTFSANNAEIDAGITVRLQKGNGQSGVFAPGTLNTTNKIWSFSGTKDVDCCLQVRIAGGITLNNFTFRPQLELGSTATAYEPYQGQEFPIDLDSIELAKIGTYQDRIYKTDGKWYIEKQVGKVVLNGSESWWIANGTLYTADITDYATTGNTPLSDYFTGQSNVLGAGDVADNRIAFNNSTQYNYRFYIRCTPKFASVSDLTTWLGTHPTTVYYALATPTTTEITNSELVGQLERLGVATLYVGLNNVLVATNNVAPTLKIDYKLTVKEPVYDDRSDELVGWIIYPDGRKKKIKEIRRVYPT